jgi:hypothetical protein
MKETAKHVPDAGSYAPATILVDERPDGVHLSYDKMVARIDAEAQAANAEAAAARAVANVSSAEALITDLKLAIEKKRRELYGSPSERGVSSSIRWNLSWKTSKPPPPKTRPQPREPPLSVVACI